MATIDFRKRQEDYQNELDELLAGRREGIGASLASTRGQILTERPELSSFGGRAEGIASQYNIPQIQGVETGLNQGQRLNTQLDEILGEEGYNQQRGRINTSYNLALQRAQEAGLDRREAENFARQMMQDEMNRQQQAKMNEKQRQDAIKKQQIGNQASLRGEAIEQQYQDNGEGDYQAALYRILAGIPSQLLSYYALNKQFPQQGTPDLTKYGDINRTRQVGLREGTGFTSRDLFSNQTRIIGR